MNLHLPSDVLSRAQSGDVKAREAVCKRMEPILVALSKRFTSGSTLEQDDLIQEGYVAVLECLATFDPSNGASFETYTYGPVRAAMSNASAKSVGGPTVPSRTLKAYFASLRLAGGDVAVAHANAQDVGITSETWAMVHQTVTGTWSIHQDSAWATREANEGLGDDKAEHWDVAQPDPLEEVASLMEAEAYLAVLTDPREVGVLKMLMGFDGREPMSQAEVGKAIGVSQQMVTKISTRALGKIREALTEGK